jgi:predicted RND superfamily exporter protein
VFLLIGIAALLLVAFFFTARHLIRAHQWAEAEARREAAQQESERQDIIDITALIERSEQSDAEATPTRNTWMRS